MAYCCSSVVDHGREKIREKDLFPLLGDLGDFDDLFFRISSIFSESGKIISYLLKSPGSTSIDQEYPEKGKKAKSSATDQNFPITYLHYEMSRGKVKE